MCGGQCLVEQETWGESGIGPRAHSGGGSQFVQVTPLTQPAVKITASNIPPFTSDEFLVTVVPAWKVVSHIRKILSGCKSPLLRHVVSHRR